MKANATRFTVWPFWPLRYSPLYSIGLRPKLDSTFGLSGFHTCDRQFPKEYSEKLRKLAEGLEPTTTGLQNRSSAN